MLRIGKLAVSSASGVSSRTALPSTLPDDDPPPTPLEMDETIRDEVVYLGLPVQATGHRQKSATAMPRKAWLATCAARLDVADVSST